MDRCKSFSPTTMANHDRGSHRLRPAAEWLADVVPPRGLNGRCQRVLPLAGVDAVRPEGRNHACISSVIEFSMRVADIPRRGGTYFIDN